MFVRNRSWELRTLQEDPAWEMIAGVYLRHGSPTHSLSCSSKVDETFWSLKRWDWSPGRLSPLMLDELGATVGDQVVNILLRVEGSSATLRESP